MGFFGGVGRKIDSIKQQALAHTNSQAAEHTQASPTAAKARAKRAAMHVPKHKLSSKNQAFVKKFGYGDLKEDQVTRYRHRSAAFMKAVDHMAAKSGDPALSRLARDTIKQAGEDPAKRKTVDNLYRMFCKGHVDPKHAARIMTLVARSPGLDLKSPGGRVALNEVIETKEFRTGKLSANNTTAIVNATARSHVSEARVKKAVPAMAKYMARSKTAHVLLRAKSAVLAQISTSNKAPRTEDGKTSLQKDFGLLDKHLDKIATSSNPSAEAEKLEKEVKSTVRARTREVRKRVIGQYDAVLARQGFGKLYRRELAASLYDMGGPSSPLGQIVLKRIGLNKQINLMRSDDTAQTWARSMAAKMDQAAGSFQPSQWQRIDTAGLAGPKAGGAPEKSRLTKAADKLGNALSIIGQAADTGQIVTETLGFAGSEAAAALTATTTAVVGSVLTLSQIGYQWKRLEAGQDDFYAKRGHLNALMAVAQRYENGKLSKLPSTRQALGDSWKSQVSNKTNPFHQGPLTRSAKAKYDETFTDTYIHLATMPPRLAGAFANAMVIAHGIDVTKWRRYDD